MMIAPDFLARKEEKKMGGLWNNLRGGGENADYGGMVQPSQQDVTSKKRGSVEEVCGADYEGMVQPSQQDVTP